MSFVDSVQLNESIDPFEAYHLVVCKDSNRSFIAQGR